jgi:hypothetical protein
MGTDERKEEGDVVERICQDQILRKLLSERFNCSQCSEFKRRGGRSITRCLAHLEQLKAELSDSHKKPEK